MVYGLLGLGRHNMLIQTLKISQMEEKKKANLSFRGVMAYLKPLASTNLKLCDSLKIERLKTGLSRLMISCCLSRPNLNHFFDGFL